jgi:hypothetical protein
MDVISRHELVTDYPSDAVVVVPLAPDPAKSNGGFGVRVALEDGDLWVTIESAFGCDDVNPVNLSSEQATQLGWALIGLARQAARQDAP